MGSILSIIVSAAIFFSELKIKNHIDKNPKQNKELCNGHVIITKLHNKGIMLGKLSSKPGIMKLLITLSLVVVYIFYIPILFKKGHLPAKLGLGMFLGGAWSNFYDHFVRGYVVDYIKVPHGFIKKIVFNLADLFIAVGAIIVSIYSLFSSK